MLKTLAKYLLLIFSLTPFYAESATGDSDRHAISAHVKSFAPNAGGQDAYRLEWYHNRNAVYGFENRSLLVGSKNLMGVGYDYRLPVCDSSCFWQFFAQVGGGLTNAGGFAEISWGTIIPILPIWLPMSSPKYIPGLRIDITSQFYATRQRVILWSYPIWAGITIAF